MYSLSHPVSGLNAGGFILLLHHILPPLPAGPMLRPVSPARPNLPARLGHFPLCSRACVPFYPIALHSRSKTPNLAFEILCQFIVSFG